MKSIRLVFKIFRQHTNGITVRILVILLLLLALIEMWCIFKTPIAQLFPESITSPRMCLSNDTYLLKALNRTSSSYCKQRFREVLCSTQLELIMPDHCPYTLSLPGSAYLNVATQLLHILGCFSIDRSLLFSTNISGSASNVDTLFANQTLSDCVHWCQLSGLPYAYVRVQSPSVCVCQSYVPATAVMVPAALCRTSCAIAIDSEQNSSSGNYQLCNRTIPMEVVATGARSTYYQSTSNFYWPPTTAYPKPVRVVYLIICHGRSWLQLKRLFRLIYHNRHFYYIHVDSRSDYLYIKAHELANRFPANVFLESNRTATTWGGTGLLTVMLHAMRELFSGSLRHWSWDFLVNLSAADLPIRPHHQLISYLTANQGKIFLKSAGSGQRYLLDQGFGKVFYECDGYIWCLGRRPLPKGVLIDGGSDWFVLPSDFLRYVTLGKDKLVQSIINYYKHSLLPVESFFHILAQNSHFCDRVVNHHLRLINWQRPRGCECKQDSVVDWCGCSPITLSGHASLHWLICTVLGTCGDQEQPLAARTEMNPVFFTRKVDPTIDLGLINTVITKLLGSSAVGNNWNYYLEELYSSQGTYEDIPLTWNIYLPLLARMIPKPLEYVSANNNELKIFAVFRAADQPSSTGTSSVGPHPTDYYHISLPQLVFQVHLNSSKKMASAMYMEMLMDQPQLAYVAQPNSNPIILPGEIVYLELSSMYDTKEQVFRNYPRLVTTADSLVLMLVWRSQHPSSTISFHLSLSGPSSLRSNMTCRHILHPPVGKIRTVQQHSPAGFTAVCDKCLLTFSTQVKAELFPDCPPLQAGFWSITAASQISTTSALLRPVVAHFALLPSSIGNQDIGNHLTLWRENQPAAYCISPMPVSDSFNEQSSVVDCRQTAWSSLSKDPKSDLDHCINLSTGQLEADGHCP